MIVFLLAIAFITGCISTPVNHVVISAGNDTKIVSVEVADSPDEWRTGLMNRQSLPENSGMLFVFSDEQQRSFWMKNTLIPLDMIFISSNFSIIDITTMQPCKADSCPSYNSKAPAQYVLEVNANYARSNNIALGTRVAFSKS